MAGEQGLHQVRCALCAAALVAGCQGAQGASMEEAPENASESVRDAGGDMSDAASETPPVREDDEDASTEGDREQRVLVMDNCLGESCERSELPEQPPFEFLSDAEDGWAWLVKADWQLAAGAEGYRCVRFTAPEDVYITSIWPAAPLGTHHTTLEVGDGSGAEGVTACGPAQSNGRRLAGAGVGTAAFSFPEGAAIKIAKGEQLFMNLHLFNVGDEPLTGTSGMRVKTTKAVDADHQAEIVMAGPLSLAIPPGRSTAKSDCTLPRDVTLFGVGPHMHQLGSYIKVTAHSSIVGDRVILDDDYDFTHQLFYPIDEIPLAAGDKVSVECTYANDSTQTVHWGNSTRDEMCFGILGVYPAEGVSGLCLQ